MSIKESELDRRLELLRHRLMKLFEEKGTFLDPKVIQVSEEMDLLIVQLQRDMLSS